MRRSFAGSDAGAYRSSFLVRQAGFLLGFVTLLVALLLALLLPTAAVAKPAANGGGTATLRVQTKVLGSYPAKSGLFVIKVVQIGAKAPGQKKLIKRKLSRVGRIQILKVPKGTYRVIPKATVRFEENGTTRAFRASPGRRTVKFNERKRGITLRFVYRPIGGGGGCVNCGPPGIKFTNLANAIGLVSVSSASRGGSGSAQRNQPATNLMALLPSGELKEAISYSGSSGGPPIATQIQRFLIGPDGAVYIVFQPGVYLEGTTYNPGQPYSSGCVLVRVEPETGAASCVDTELNWVNTYNMSYGGPAGIYRPNEPVQFDSSGAIYYAGFKSGFSSSQTLLRRKKRDGTIDDLVPAANVQVGSFEVTPGGTVLMTGNNNGGSFSPWFRSIDPSGRLRNISFPGESLTSTSFPSIFRLSDNRVYAVSNAYDYSYDSRQVNPQKVFPFDDSSSGLASQPWIGPAAGNPVHSYDNFCSGLGSDAYTAWSWVCGLGPSNGWSNSYRSLPIASRFSSGNRDYLIWPGTSETCCGQRPSKVQILRIFPGLDGAETSLDSITSADLRGNRFVLAGKRNGQYIVVSFNMDTGVEAVLIPPEDEIEVYNIRISPSGERAFFEGLRFADNSYRFGEIDLNARTYSADKASPGRWQQFEVFG